MLASDLGRCDFLWRQRRMLQWFLWSRSRFSYLWVWKEKEIHMWYALCGLQVMTINDVFDFLLLPDSQFLVLLFLSHAYVSKCVYSYWSFSLFLSSPTFICHLAAHSTERSEWMTDVSIWVYNKKKKLKYNARKIEAWKCCSNCGIQSSTYSTWTQYKEVLSRVDAIHTMKGITCSNDKRLTGQPTERKRLRLTDAVLLVWSSAVLIAVEELSYRPTLMCKLLLSAGTLVGTRNEKRTPNGSAHSRSRCYT